MASRRQPPAEHAGASSGRSPSRREQIRLLIGGAATVLVLVFALVNLDKVKVDWIVTTSHTPLIVVIAITFLLGAAAGAIFWRQRVRR